MAIAVLISTITRLRLPDRDVSVDVLAAIFDGVDMLLSYASSEI
jgi:hypothetical protein